MRILAVAMLIGLLVLSAACSAGSEPPQPTRPSTPADFTVLEKTRGVLPARLTIWLHGAERTVEFGQFDCATDVRRESNIEAWRKLGILECDQYCWDTPLGSVLPAKCR